MFVKNSFENIVNLEIKLQTYLTKTIKDLNFKVKRIPKL